MSITRIYESKHYYGLESELPNKLQLGDTYYATDTEKKYTYNKDGSPVLIGENSGGGGNSTSGVQSIQEGSNITVDDTDPQNPIVSASASSGGGGIDFNIEDFGAVADGTTDATQAYMDAVDAAIAVGGGKVIIPPRVNRFLITINQANFIRDYSNIEITGGGSIFIDSSNANVGVSQGRGILVVVADGTENFKCNNLDILVSEGCFSNLRRDGVIMQDARAGWSNIYLEKLKIHTEPKPDSQLGSLAINFYRNTLDATDDAKCFNLTIRDCDLLITGQETYVIRLLRDIENVLIDNNVIEMTANSVDSADAFNPIAVYGDCKNFSVTNNTINGGGHSAIAASMSENGVIAFNRVYNVNIVSEAGIEVEYKLGHGTEGFQTKSVKVHNNYVENCTWGIAVLTREIFGSGSPTDKPPHDVQITNNTIINSEEHGIVVGSQLSGIPDYTNGRIENVTVSQNYIEADVGFGSTGIYFSDSRGGKILNNTVKGHARSLKLGRDSSIKPTGNFDITGNEFIGNSDSVGQLVRIEAISDNSIILFCNNTCKAIDSIVTGMQFSNLSASNVLIMIRNNFLENCLDGILISGSSAALRGSSLIGNTAINCTDKGFQVGITDGIATDNVSINCANNNQINGTGMTITGNKDL